MHDDFLRLKPSDAIKVVTELVLRYSECHTQTKALAMEFANDIYKQAIKIKDNQNKPLA